MIPILVVSMKTDIARREIISRKMEEYQLDFIFIDAVIGKNLNESDLDSIDLTKATARKKRYVSLGEIGCTLSHVKALKFIIDNAYPFCLILEDDAIFDERLANFVKYFNGDIFAHNTNDLFILGGQDGIDKSKYISKSFFSKVKSSNTIFAKAIKSENFIFRTCCYMVSLEVSRKLYELSQNEFFIADEWAYFKDIKIFRDVYISDIVGHPLDLSGSHIEMERVNSINTYKNPASKKNIKSYLDGFLLFRLAKLLFLKPAKHLFLFMRTFLRRFRF